MIWNEALECLPRADLEILQARRLAEVVRRVYERVPFYKRKLDLSGIRTDSIKTLADLERLPFTFKADLRDGYPFGLFAVSREQVIRLHASTGTTGKPTVVGYSRHDLQVWAELCARCLVMSGARAGQVFQNAYGYGLFTGGLGLHYGAELLGMTVVPASTGNTARQIMLMEDFGTEVLACTPSYALTLADALQDCQIESGRLRLRTLLLGAEPWTEEMRAETESRLKVQALNIYGLSEIIGPGVSSECIETKAGSHIFEDHFIPEIVDPKSGHRLEDGMIGELVLTTLTKQALPLLRFRTGDLTSMSHLPCGCGRTHARMSRIVGRTDDMLIIRGVNVFPSQIEAALLGAENVSAHHQIVLSRVGNRDDLEVQVEVTTTFFQLIGEEVLLNEQRAPDSIVEKQTVMLERRLHDSLGLHTRVKLLPPNALPRSEGGKVCRVVDLRSKPIY
jgi:phenylacetate-CoA ligase